MVVTAKGAEDLSQIRQLLEQLPSGVLVVDSQRHVLFANAPLSRMLGQIAEDLTGTRLDVLLPELSLETTPAEGEQIEFGVTWPDGSTHWLCGKVSSALLPGCTVFFFEDRTNDVASRKALERSEERYRRLIETSPASMYRCDAEGALVWSSPQFLELAGVENRDIQGFSWHEIIHPADLPEVARLWEISRNQKIPFRCDYRVRLADGTYRWFLGSISPVKDESGALLEWIGSGTDIHDQKEAEIALAEQTRLLQTITDNATQGLLMMDRDGMCTFMNPAAEAMLGYDQNEIRQKPLHDLIHHTRPDGTPYPLHECPIDRALPENFDMREHEDVFIRKNGQFFPVLVGASPIFGEDGKPRSTVIEVRDVTERHRSDEALRKSEDQLRLVTDNLPALIAYVGNDLRYHFVNRAYRDWFGVEPSSIVGAHISDVLGPAAMERLRPQIDAALSGKRVSFNSAVPYQKGATRHVEAEYIPDIRPDGSVAGYFSMVLDATSRVEAERARIRSEEVFRRVFEHAGFGILMAGGDGQVFRVNPAILNLLGHDEKEILGKGYLELVHPEDREESGRLVKQVLERKVSSVETECRYQNQQGEPVWVRVTISLVPGEDASEGAIAVLVTDISPLRASNQALRESEARFRSVANAAPILMWLVDARGQVEFINDTYRTFLGLTIESVHQTGWAHLLHPDDAARSSEAFGRALREQSRLESQGRVKTADGRWRWLRSTAVPRFGGDGTFLGLVGTSMDITELVEFQTELERSVAERTEELLEVNAQLNGFTYSVAHDLRQQIRGISVNAGMVLHDLDDVLDEDSRTNLQRMVRSAKHLAQLTDDLLAYAKLARQDVRNGKIDLTALAHDVLRAVREQEHWQAACEVSVQPDMKAVGDESMVRLALANLLDNASKYSQDQPRPIIEFGQDEQGFFVRDNGIGFSTEFSDKLFEPFERLHRNDSYGGTGIGLANVKRIVEKHGGRIWAESSPGAGATFRFTLQHKAS